ncbi:hypothetical protein DPMN_166401 [Dreissena polymorpha]|uniref:Uncharacterized protein n=1 Tax=Dreissena polymorpha TaxID=45954 RepID=A0A9D4EYS5_DREPO|nr:hypothetical protein DPMN_166401 [Dreissena polymorpha]
MGFGLNMFHLSHGNHGLNSTRIETVGKGLLYDEEHNMNVVTLCMTSSLCVAETVIVEWTQH